MKQKGTRGRRPYGFKTVRFGAWIRDDQETDLKAKGGYKGSEYVRRSLDVLKVVEADPDLLLVVNGKLEAQNVPTT